MLEALRAGRDVRRVLLARGSHGPAVDAIRRLAGQRGVQVEEVDRRQLEARAETEGHQGVIALAAPRPAVDWRDVVDRTAAGGGEPLVVIAAGVEDPRNLGAMARCAEAAGAHLLILPTRRSVGLTPAAVKASAGAVEFLPVAWVPNLARCLEDLKGRGLWVCGAEADGEMVYWNADLRGPLAVVVGGEGRGIPRLVRERCDFTVRIPLYGHAASLNAAVALGILLYEIRRQRAAGDASP